MFYADTGLASDSTQPQEIQKIVATTIEPLLKKYHIPGMAVAINIQGQNYFYNYGVASKATHEPVTNATLFEIGSVSKTFTATLATYAQTQGQLKLADNVSHYVPELRDSSFDHITLLNLATHTAGDFPLQVPDSIQNEEQLMAYYRKWKSSYTAGTKRTYTNPGIGLLGLITARQMHMPYAAAIQTVLFPELGMLHSYINVPSEQMKNYAQGYNQDDKPVRVNPGMLADEAYGVKTTSEDLIHFIQANLHPQSQSKNIRQAILDTQHDYYRAGEITQELIWEQYPVTAERAQLVEGNSPAMLDTLPAHSLPATEEPLTAVYRNKTGSTGGFGAYVVFAPAKDIGIVMLANKNYPNSARVNAAFDILKQLELRNF